MASAAGGRQMYVVLPFLLYGLRVRGLGAVVGRAVEIAVAVMLTLPPFTHTLFGCDYTFHFAWVNGAHWVRGLEWN